MHLVNKFLVLPAQLPRGHDLNSSMNNPGYFSSVSFVQLTQSKMGVKTTVIGVYPKPDYHKLPVWYKEGEGNMHCDLYDKFMNSMSAEEREEFDKTTRKVQQEVSWYLVHQVFILSLLFEEIHVTWVCLHYLTLTYQCHCPHGPLPSSHAQYHMLSNGKNWLCSALSL